MAETWFDRLAQAVERDPRSLRAISEAAGCGPNYLQQMIKDRKEPGVERFLRIVNALGTGSALYIMTGVNLTHEDEEFFRLVLNVPASVRAKALPLLESLRPAEAK